MTGTGPILSLGIRPVCPLRTCPSRMSRGPAMPAWFTLTGPRRTFQLKRLPLRTSQDEVEACRHVGMTSTRVASSADALGQLLNIVALLVVLSGTALGVFGLVAAHAASTGLSGSGRLVVGIAGWGTAVSVLIVVFSVVGSVGLAAAGYVLRLLAAIHTQLEAANKLRGQSSPGIVHPSPAPIPTISTSQSGV